MAQAVILGSWTSALPQLDQMGPRFPLVVAALRQIDRNPTSWDKMRRSGRCRVRISSIWHKVDA
jgi:hypothetical protein